MTEPLVRPKRKDPLKRTRLPLSPPGARSRTALGLAAAAAQGRFMLQVCPDCAKTIYPPRDACPGCFAPTPPFCDVPDGGVLLAVTTIRTSTDAYYRERMPWRVGTVRLDCGPSVVAHVHGDLNEGDRVAMSLKLDRSGQAVAFALPARETPDMADDKQLREMTCDPKFRRALVTDGRTAVGQACAKALSDAGCAIVFVGVADPWKPFPGEDALRKIANVEIVPLDLTNSESVGDLAADIGGRVDIVVNTAEHVRPGGIMARKGLVVAREEMDIRYFGLMRLAQAFGPALRFRGADGVNSATAFVNFLFVHALANWPDFGAYSATEAACLSASHSLRAELRPGGVKFINIFHGPLETEWFQPLPPPKVAPAQLARSAVDALKRGLEDVFVGDIAQDIRERFLANPKALEREL
ncbi:MAG TPA: SDR family oxidoreductase [Rhodoblastus sp.]|nr:SDR family oxidoreductase [Rhodoblastus sp.]